MPGAPQTRNSLFDWSELEEARPARAGEAPVGGHGSPSGCPSGAAACAAAAPQPLAGDDAAPGELGVEGSEGLYEVAFERVAVRATPSTSGRVRSVLRRGAEVCGTLRRVEGLPWLRLSQAPDGGTGDAWVLADARGTSLGLGQLLRPLPGAGTGAPALEVLEDVGSRRDAGSLLSRVQELRRQGFADGHFTGDMASGKHVTVLVDAAHASVAGYCLYRFVAETLHIEELVVAECHRGQGLGRRLLQWAVEVSLRRGLSTVSLAPQEDAGAPFASLGFEASEDELCPGLWRSELCLAHGAALRHFERAAAPGAAPGAAPDAPGAGPLSCLVASHVSSLERLERLADMLASVARQRPRPPPLLISWSAGGAELRRRARALLAGAAREIPGLRAAEQPTPRSQFQHLAAGAALAGAGGWVFFSDDDDLWHPDRHAEYLRAIATAQGRREVVSVVAASHAVLCRGGRGRATRPEDVDGLLARGLCVLSEPGAWARGPGGEAAEADEPGGGAGRPPGPEYFDMAVRLDQFRALINSTHPSVRANKFCDRHVLSRFCSQEGSGRTHWFRPESWLYFYSRADGITRVQPGMYQGGASAGVEVRPADRSLAGRHSGLCNRGFCADEVAFLAAKFRASIEEQLVCSGIPRMGWVGSREMQEVCRVAVKSRDFDNCDQDLAFALAEDVGKEVCLALRLDVRDSSRACDDN